MTGQRPRGTDAKSAILDLLRRAGKHGLLSSDLMRTHSRAQARIGELRADGWQITTTMEDGVARYTLTSSEQEKVPDTVFGFRVVIREDGSMQLMPYANCDIELGEEDTDALNEGVLDAVDAILSGVRDDLRSSWARRR